MPTPSVAALQFRFTAGQASDIAWGARPVGSSAPGAELADYACYGNDLRDPIAGRNAGAGIRSNAIARAPSFDVGIDEHRNPIEPRFSDLTSFRRFATRYDGRTIDLTALYASPLQ